MNQETKEARALMGLPKINDCPFCGGCITLLVMEPPGFHVTCNNCLARGPRIHPLDPKTPAQASVTAVQMWNKVK